jgi:uncharacterized OB-fold protein
MTDHTQRQIPAPLINPENAPFYEAAAQGQLLLGKCNDCAEYHFYPRLLCPHCFSANTEWVPARGSGTIYSFSTMRRGVPVPYTIAYVTLDEGVSMLTNIVDCDPDSLNIGDKVGVVFRKAEDGSAVPVFAPAAA